ncbi:phage tail protein [Thermodesulfovibrio sp.]|uniref:phage tail-collar fiber domain-containing protein n=1 Tax=Thermodesulfovibrio sp. TaxID=2067987 RepID=UPI00309DF3A8
MGDFIGTILTNRGRNLLAKAQTGVQLNFTRVAIGDGIWQEGVDPVEMVTLVNEKHRLPIQSIELTGDGTVRLRFILTNNGLTEGFFIREIGIFAQDPDIGEILYAVTYAGDRADYIPAYGVTLIENVVDIYTVIANAQNVTALISDTVVIATKKDIYEHNKSTSSHLDIRDKLVSHIDSLTAHNIQTQIASAINEHKLTGHEGYSVRIEHTQQTPSTTWTVIHNRNTLNIPVVRAYSITTEEISLSGYCGSGIYCGSGTYCGSGQMMEVPVLTELPISSILHVSGSRLDIRFAQAQAGKAVILL